MSRRDPTPISDDRIDELVDATSRAQISMAARWVEQKHISRRTGWEGHVVSNVLAAAIIGGYVHSRGYGSDLGSRSGDAYQLTNAGWEAAGGKPIWL